MDDYRGWTWQNKCTGGCGVEGINSWMALIRLGRLRGLHYCPVTPIIKHAFYLVACTLPFFFCETTWLIGTLCMMWLRIQTEVFWPGDHYYSSNIQLFLQALFFFNILHSITAEEKMTQSPSPPSPLFSKCDPPIDALTMKPLSPLYEQGYTSLSQNNRAQIGERFPPPSLPL